MDDVFIYYKDRRDHDHLVDEVFQRLKNKNSRINFKKIQYGLDDV
jgi:hypothetical protein